MFLGLLFWADFGRKLRKALNALLKVIGSILCIIFASGFLYAYDMCSPNKCSGYQSVVYVIPFAMFFTILPLGIGLIIISFFFKNAENKKRPKSNKLIWKIAAIALTIFSAYVVYVLLTIDATIATDQL